MTRMALNAFRSPLGLALLTALVALPLASCESEPEQSVDRNAQQIEEEGVAPVQGEVIGTPMAERVAVIGLLNKRNGSTRDLELKPGQALRIGERLVVRVRACERTAPWENHPEQGAFVQLLVNEKQVGDRGDDWRRVFSGWLFKENPALNVVEHPIYDVWVKECRMSFPDEAAASSDDPSTDGASDGGSEAASSESSADQSAEPAEAEPAEPEGDAAE